MGDIQKYYENTENALPHPMVKKFINMNSNPQYAIDLGCGAGRDTIYLIKNGWKVLSIDKENTREIISSKLDNEELKNFNFECQDFENMELEKNNYITIGAMTDTCDEPEAEEMLKALTNAQKKFEADVAANKKIAAADKKLAKQITEDIYSEGV